MSRPALSASRGIRVMEFLAAFPRRRFTLTEIAHATEVNRASCLAILGELETRGYLSRHPKQKDYRLGPALIATGSSALVSNSTLSRAREAAERLHTTLSLPVLLSTRIEDEILCIFSIADKAGRTAGMSAGERLPLAPPIGMSFVAWLAAPEAETWIARRSRAMADDAADILHETISLVRARGFHVTLRRPDSDDMATVLAHVVSSDRAPDFKRHIADYMDRLDLDAAQPDLRAGDALYDVQLIAAPIIEPETLRQYNLCIGGFSELLTGPAIETLGTTLIAACMAVMKDG